MLPSNLDFKAFARATGNGSELLLHSSGHPTIDFTATEGGTYADNHLKHYVGVYDPLSGLLDITEAKMMTVRSIVRQARPAEDDDEAPVQPTSNYSSMSALTHTFGTKKSKKLVQSRAENVLHSRETDPNAANPLSEAILSSMPEAEAPPTTPEGRILDVAAAIQAAKPLPTPDLTATNVSQAYPLSNLVFPSPHGSTLAAMPTSKWRTLISEGREVHVAARFVAHRVAYITQAANVHPAPDSPQSTTLQLLRYIYLLIEFARAIRRFRPGKGFPPVSTWTSGRLTDQSELPVSVLNGLAEKYCPHGTGPTKSDVTLLHTTILALTLHIPPPSGDHGDSVLATNPIDIEQDLSLAHEDAGRYWRELGCKIELATQKELGIWGMNRASEKAIKAKYAKLRLPLVFPKVSKGPPSGRRR